MNNSVFKICFSKKRLFVGMLFQLVSLVSIAQVKTDTLSETESVQLYKQLNKELNRKQKKYSVQVLPVVYYTPETRFSYGGLGVINFKFNYSDSLLKSSQIIPSFVFTQNKQMLAQIKFDLYSHRKWHIWGSTGYFIYPYFFNGVGNTLAAKNVEWYEAKYPKLDINIYHQIFNEYWSFGLKYDFQDSHITPKTNQVLDTGNYAGARGSLQSSIGLGVRYDSRDYFLSPTKGWFADLSLQWADKWSGASFSNQYAKIDIRKYFTLSQKNDVLAFQIYSEIHTKEIPFNLMALLGGSQQMRGYRKGVYRDKQMWVYQLEYRSRLFFKHVGVAAFANLGGIGNTYRDVNQNYRFTYGGGLRIAPIKTERYFIRLDYGVNQMAEGLFYFAIGEAF